MYVMSLEAFDWLACALFAIRENMKLVGFSSTVAAFTSVDSMLWRFGSGREDLRGPSSMD